jgi:hypothetical protein
VYLFKLFFHLKLVAYFNLSDLSKVVDENAAGGEGLSIGEDRALYQHNVPKYVSIF